MDSRKQEKAHMNCRPCGGPTVSFLFLGILTVGWTVESKKKLIRTVGLVVDRQFLSCFLGSVLSR